MGRSYRFSFTGFAEGVHSGPPRPVFGPVAEGVVLVSMVTTEGGVGISLCDGCASCLSRCTRY